MGILGGGFHARGNRDGAGLQEGGGGVRIEMEFGWGGGWGVGDEKGCEERDTRVRRANG
jgi:hypothetical protein